MRDLILKPCDALLTTAWPWKSTFDLQLQPTHERWRLGDTPGTPQHGFPTSRDDPGRHPCWDSAEGNCRMESDSWGLGEISWCQPKRVFRGRNRWPGSGNCRDH